MSVLCLVSCQVLKQTKTTTNDHFEGANEVAADSVGGTSKATQNAIKAQVDSLFQAALQQTLDKESEASVEQTLHLVIFDTTQPTDTSTGLPPVKAALTQTTAATQKDKTQSKAQADIKAETAKEKTDSTQNLEQSASHVQINQEGSVTATSDNATQETKERSSWQFWVVVILIIAVVVVLVIIGCVYYLRRKLKL